MTRLLSLLVAAAIAATPALAAAEERRYTTVDSVFVGVDETTGSDHTLTIVGAVDAGAAETMVFFPHQNDSNDSAGRIERCHRMALVAMNKPGKWLFTVVFNIQSYRPRLRSCGLTRAPTVD